MSQPVTFKSGGITCAADLYLPPAFGPSRSYPALFVGHGTAQTKKSLVNQEEFFSRAGYAVLAIDYRSFGRAKVSPVDNSSRCSRWTIRVVRTLG